MAAGAHWVGTIAFELRASDAAALDPVRAALRGDLAAIVLAPVERALDRADRGGRVSRHRRIEIDLGRFAAGDFASGHLARRIADGFDRHLGTASLPPSPDSPHPDPGAGDEVDELLGFLTTGLLAWSAPGEALAAICTALMRRDAAAMTRAAERLRPVLANGTRAAERLVRQCPAALVRRIAAALAGPSSVGRIGLPVRDAETMPIPVGRAARWTAAIVRLARLGRHGADGAAGRADAGPAAVDAVAPVEDVKAPRRTRGVGERAPAEPARAAVGPTGTVAEADRVTDPPAADEAAPRALPVGAAGAVLLHPFLSGLFESAGLIGEDGAFPDSVAQARAVLLLHYAATGREEAAEPELALSKLLCGMDLAAIVPRRIEPTGLERAEVEALLAAMIGHWDALGDTSAAALRETFLLRPGRLARSDEGWRLEVEARGVDVLLDRLPWSMSIVRTAFMRRPLRVDWR